MCSKTASPEAVDSTPLPLTKLSTGSVVKLNSSVVQLLAVTVRVGCGCPPLELVMPTHSIAPVPPPFDPMAVPAAIVASRMPSPTRTALSLQIRKRSRLVRSMTGLGNVVTPEVVRRTHGAVALLVKAQLTLSARALVFPGGKLAVVNDTFGALLIQPEVEPEKRGS